MLFCCWFIFLVRSVTKRVFCYIAQLSPFFVGFLLIDILTLNKFPQIWQQWFCVMFVFGNELIPVTRWHPHDGFLNYDTIHIFWWKWWWWLSSLLWTIVVIIIGYFYFHNGVTRGGANGGLRYLFALCLTSHSN